MFLVCQVLREHIKSLYDYEYVDPELYEVCLARRPWDGKFDTDMERLPEGLEGWNRQLLDRNFNDFGAVDAETRGNYMRNRITVIKTLWDISTNLRARRMMDILNICKS